MSPLPHEPTSPHGELLVLCPLHPSCSIQRDAAQNHNQHSLPPASCTGKGILADVSDTPSPPLPAWATPPSSCHHTKQWQQNLVARGCRGHGIIASLTAAVTATFGFVSRCSVGICSVKC